MEQQPIRQRGGQPGNHNARKHGFYSAHLDPQEISEFWNILNNGASEPELVVLRLKMKHIYEYAPGNDRLLREAKRLLYKWFLANYDLSRHTQAEIRVFVRAFFQLDSEWKNAFA